MTPSNTEQPGPIKTGDLIDLTIEGMGSFGEGLGRLADTEIFVAKTVRGDRVQVRLLEKKKGRWRAEMIQLLSASPFRIKPVCRHFQDCGGCDFQHIQADEQAAWKMRMLKHWIRRSPLAPHLESIRFDAIASPQALAYRHRARLQVADHRIHFFKPHSHDLLPLDECSVLVDGFFEALQKEAQHMAPTKDWNQSFIEGRLVNDLSGRYEIDGCLIQFGPGCFTQGNLAVNALMWERIKEDCLQLHFKRRALDLFCGIGNFSLPLKMLFDEVVGAESHSESMRWARKNSSQILWREESALDALNAVIRERQAFDFVLLDPPRLGALEEMEGLARLMPPLLVYVSCNPETLVRDLIRLTKKSPYKIRRWTLADLFPQTHHIESIVTLSL